MSNDGKKKTKTAPTKQEVATETKAAEAKPAEAKTAEAAPKAEGAKTEAVKPDASPSRQGMGEGQKLVTQAYKDNWNAIFGKKKKR